MSCMIPACLRADFAEAMSTVTLNLIIQQQSTVSLTYSCDTIVANFYAIPLCDGTWASDAYIM